MRKKWLALFVFVICAVLLGSIAPGSAAADVVVPEQRIPLSDSGSASGKWNAQDLSVEYQYTTGPGGLVLSGTLVFDDSIKLNYGILNYLHAEIIFADNQGRVLGTQSLLTNRQGGSFGGLDDVKFDMRSPLPPGTAAFAFSYTGEVKETGGGGRHGGGGSNPTRIWTSPVVKAGRY